MAKIKGKIDSLEGLFFNTKACEKYDFTPEFIDKYGEHMDWSVLSTNKKLSSDILRKYAHKLDWEQVTMHCKLSFDFIEEFSNKIVWGKLHRNSLFFNSNKKATEFMFKHIEKFNPEAFHYREYVPEKLIRLNEKSLKPETIVKLIANSDKVSINYIYEVLDKYYKNLKINDWKELINKQLNKQLNNLMEEFVWKLIEYYPNKLIDGAAELISIKMPENLYRYITEKVVETGDKVRINDYFCELCNYQELSNEFLEIYEEFLFWNYMFTRQAITYEMAAKNMDKVEKFYIKYLIEGRNERSRLSEEEIESLKVAFAMNG